MSTYRSRPVFEFSIDWKSKPSIKPDFDLDEYEIGFGKIRVDPMQDEVEHGFDVTVWLDSFAAIVEINDFFDALLGNTRGFWFASPYYAFRIDAGVDATSFDIEDAGFTESWLDHPSRAFVCFKKDSSLQYAKIIDVSDNGDGTERVTLEETLSTAVDETWDAFSLFFVKLDRERESGTFDAEGGKMTRKFRLRELTKEYDTQHLGTQVAYLYKFTAQIGGTSRTWEFTSYYRNLRSQAVTFQAAAITHRSVRRDLEGNSQSAEIEAEYVTGNPMTLLAPVKIPARLYVEIIKVELDSLDIRQTEFSGEVSKPRINGKKISASVKSIFDLGRKVPAFRIQRLCQYDLFDESTCKASRASFEVSASIDFIEGKTVVISGAGLSGLATGYFGDGWVEVGSGDSFEIATIIQDIATDATEHTLTLSKALNFASVSDSIAVLPGDDMTFETCVAKYGNGDNHGGHPHGPNRNMTLDGVDYQPSGGGKK